MTVKRSSARMLPRFVAGVCASAALPGCLTPAGYERSDPPASLHASPMPPVSRAQQDSGPITPVTWLRPGETIVQPPGEPAFPAIAQPPKAPEPVKPLEVPRGMPGADAPQLTLPPNTPENRAERLKLIDQYFPEFAALTVDPLIDGPPGAKPVTIEELLDFAMKNSPDLVQASADVADAHGRWVQAGLYPNPTIGFQGDQMLDMGFAGQLGGYFNQPIVTGGKLGLARAVAQFDYVNARVKLRKAEVALAQRVRTFHNQAMVAAENVRINRLIVAFTDDVYRRQVLLVKGGSAAAFEASALLALTGQAELSLNQSRNRYASAWKQLAATINSPDLPPAPLAGRAAEPLPRYRYESLREQMLAIHTDVVVARNAAVQAERAIAREQAKPIPDLQNQFYFQQDTQAKSLGLANFQMGAQIGVSVPLFDRNQGGIISAKAQFARASAETPRVQNELTRQLADAFERYEAARQQTELYRDRILPNLATAFRGVYQRYQVEPDKVNYNDIVTAQQNFGTQLAGYLGVLQQLWQAQADLAGAVQVTHPSELARPEMPQPDTWPEALQRGVKK